MTSALAVGLVLVSPGSGPVNVSTVLEIGLLLLLLVALGAIIGYGVGRAQEGRT